MLKFTGYSVARIPIYIDPYKIIAVTSGANNEKGCVIVYTPVAEFYVEGDIDEIVQQIQDAY